MNNKLLRVLVAASLQNYHFITSTCFFALYFYYAFYSATYYFFYISHHHPLFCPTLLRFYFALYVLRLYLLNLINSIRHLADTYIAFSHMIASASISFEPALVSWPFFRFRFEIFIYPRRKHDTTSLRCIVQLNDNDRESKSSTPMRLFLSLSLPLSRPSLS